MSVAPPILPTEIDKASYREGRNDAIEECARVVADRADWTSDRDLRDALVAVAAAIRALKDKP